MEAPDRIYLQAGMTEEDEDWDDEVGVTWCIDQINDNDVEYVRRDVAVKLREMLAVAMSVHIMNDEQIDKADELLSETAWLEEEVTTDD